MSDKQAASRIRLGIIGAGIYARTAHLPALLKLQDRFQIVAVASRGLQSAGELAALSGQQPDVTIDVPALLARPDVDAVAIILPIPTQPAVLAQALAAGKHVISEKPIAPDLETAGRLIAEHRRHPGQVWMVGENWRYEDAFVRAAELVQAGAVGRLVATHMALYLPHTPSNKYWSTAWRRSGDYPGGFLMDGGVHYIAAQRMIVGEIAAVAALAVQASPALPPVDTLTATLQFANGALGSYLNTFAVGTPWSAPLTVVGEKGSLCIDRGRLELSDPENNVQQIKVAAYNGTEAELAAFADAIQYGAPHRNTPAEGLRDVAVIAAMLRSAQSGRLEAVD